MLVFALVYVALGIAGFFIRDLMVYHADPKINAVHLAVGMLGLLAAAGSAPQARRAASTAVVVALATSVLHACASGGYATMQATTPAARTTSAASLYQRLGGQPALTMVVDTFTAHLAGDSRINRMFRGVDVANLKRLLVEQLCDATGGPCRYSGRSMREAHRGMGIADAQWDITVEHLVMVLNQFRVPEREKHELLEILGPLKGQIVGQ